MLFIIFRQLSSRPAKAALRYHYIIHQFSNAAWRAAIRRESASFAANPQDRQDLLGTKIDRNQLVTSTPSMSQLGGLRSIVMTSLNSDPDQNSIVNNWIDELPPKITEKWASGSLDKIRTLLTTPDCVWTVFKNIKFDQLTLTQDGAKALKQELWRETVQIVVLDCIRAHKRELEPKSEPGD